MSRCTGNVPVNRLEEPQKLLVAMPAMTFADHLAGGHIQRGEQRRRPVASVVVRAPLRDGARHAWSRFIQQALEPRLQEARAPLADGGLGHPLATRDRCVRIALGRPQHRRLRRRAQPSSADRSSVVNTIGVSGRPSRIGKSSL